MIHTLTEFQALLLYGALVFCFGPHYHGLVCSIRLLVRLDLTMSCGTNVLISIFDVPGTLFHISVLICIVHAIAAGSKGFRSAFYVLFCVVTTLDVLQMIQVVVSSARTISPPIKPYLANRLRDCGYFPRLYEGNRWVGLFDQVGGQYIEVCQFLGHVLTSANRFTAFVLSLKHEMVTASPHLNGGTV